MDFASGYIEGLQARGRQTFSTTEIAGALGKSAKAVRAQLWRLKQKGRIAVPVRGFHVVVPPQYRRLGCPPAEQFIGQLMEHLGQPYYVTLLSAAAYHGAAHQKPQVFQIMVPKARRSVGVGGVQIDFVARRDMEGTSVVCRNTPTGIIQIASPAATAVELAGYPERCGYLDNVATVVAELAESVEGKELGMEARRAPVAWIQRLGYLLDLLGHESLASRLEAVLATKRVFPVPLAPWNPDQRTHRNRRWNVRINAKVEPDT